jgi:hypothetical protein
MNKLFLCHISELGNPHLVGFSGIKIVLMDEFKILSKDLESELFFKWFIMTIKVMFEAIELALEQ